MNTAERLLWADPNGWITTVDKGILQQIDYVGISELSVEVHFEDGSGIRVTADNSANLFTRVLDPA